MKRFPLFFGILIGLAAASARGVVYQYDNSSQWLYHNSIPQTPGYLTPFAEPGKFAIGQVFAPPADGVSLEIAGLWVSRPVALSDLSLDIYFAEWDAVRSRVAGPVYTFAGVDYIFSPSPTSGLGDYSRIDFNTPHLALSETKNYILFMTMAPFSPDMAATAKFGYDPFGGYWGHAWSLDGTRPEDAGGKSWTPYDGNLVIQVQFNSIDSPLSPVPEPATYGTVASGLLMAVAGYRRYRGTCRRA